MRLVAILFVVLLAAWISTFPRWEVALTYVALKPLPYLSHFLCLYKHGFNPQGCGVAEQFEATNDLCSLTFHPLQNSGFTIQHVNYTTKDGSELVMTVGIPKSYEKGTKLPILLEYHSGGHILLNSDQITIAPHLVKNFNFILFSPNYRKAPKFKFPTAANDAYDALLWVKKNAEKFGGDTSKLFLGGTSAGGNLAAAVAIEARDSGFSPKIHALILVAPLLDFHLQTLTYVAYSATPVWNSVLSLAARGLYIPSIKDWADPRASPLVVPSVENFPPTFLVTYTYDTLYLEAILFKERLEKANIRVEHVNIDTYHIGDVFMNSMLPFMHKTEIEEYFGKISKFVGKFFATKY